MADISYWASCNQRSLPCVLITPCNRLQHPCSCRTPLDRFTRHDPTFLMFGYHMSLFHDLLQDEELGEAIDSANKMCTALHEMEYPFRRIRII